MRAGLGASWPTCSTLPSLALRFRAHCESESSFGQSCQAGARSEVNSLQFQGLALGHPTLPKRHPLPPPNPTGHLKVQCTCVRYVRCAATRTARWRSQSLLHRIAPFPLSRTQANGAGGLTGTAHLERQNEFAIAGPEQGLWRVHCKHVAAGWSLAANGCNAITIMQRRD